MSFAEAWERAWNANPELWKDTGTPVVSATAIERV
jgi:hypothetical protein